MKITKENGETIECTVQEYLELKAQENKETPYEIPKEMQKPERKYTGRHVNPEKWKGNGQPMWTPAEIQILKDNKDLNRNEIHKLLPNRTVGAITWRINYLGLKSKRIQIPKAHKSEWSKQEIQYLKDNAPNTEGVSELTKKFNKTFAPRTESSIYQRLWKEGIQTKLKTKTNKKIGRYDKTVERMKFMQQRAKYYMNTYQWSFPKARKQAFFDYNNNNKQGLLKPLIFKDTQTSEPASDSHYWYYLAEESHKHFDMMIQTLYEGNINSIGYYDMLNLKLKFGETWSKEKYQEFLVWFIMKTEKISKTLNIPNKFKITDDEIRYER